MLIDSKVGLAPGVAFGTGGEGSVRVCYAAEMPILEAAMERLREHLSRTGDARALLRQIFQTEAGLVPEPETNTLKVRLHHLTQAAHDQAVERLIAGLNATQTTFPGTNLTLVFQLGSP